MLFETSTLIYILFTPVSGFFRKAGLSFYIYPCSSLAGVSGFSDKH